MHLQEAADRVHKGFLTELEFVGFGEVWQYVLLGFIAVGIVTGVVGSLLSLRKYMKV